MTDSLLDHQILKSRARREFRYRDDVAISYRVEGAGPAPIVFLHGFAATLATWDDIRGFFPADRFSLFFLDLKGFGRSSRPRDGAYGLTDQAAVVVAFLEATGLRNAVLVGHSLGGGVALLSLLRARSGGNEQLVGGLVLIDCAAYRQKLPPLLRLLRLPFLGWAILHLLPVSLMVRFTLMRIYHNRDTVTPERIARYVDSFSGTGIARVFIDTVRRLVRGNYGRFIPSYRAIAVPVLIIWGRHDPIIPLEFGSRLHRDIHGSRLVVIEECGHNPHEERPEQTFAAIARFLDQFFSAAH